MLLKSLSYSEHAGTPNEWIVRSLQLGAINLVVGRNASGKTRVLAAIRHLAGLLSGEALTTASASYEVQFSEADTTLEYILGIEAGRVSREEFRMDGRELLKRTAGGVGTIFARQLNAIMSFQTPDTQLAAVSRRDAIQHDFFEKLHRWGRSVHYYAFGSPMGRFSYLPADQQEPGTLDLREKDEVVAAFLAGSGKFGETFAGAIRSDMEEIGYGIEEIGIRPLRSGTIDLNGVSPARLAGLFVKEQGLSGFTTQNEMSQGMFRALSILIHLNLSRLSEVPSCILVDDIGEGLDFERCRALIRLLIRKVEQTRTQLVMSTNDRFAMNTVPLKDWTIVERQRGGVRLFNYENSREAFDNFTFTGLNNFDFFASDFVKGEIGPDGQAGDIR